MIEFSLSALNHAFQAVKANRGCAGVDGVTIRAFEKRLTPNLQTLQFELSRGAYLPLPLMKIQVAKKNGEPRGLSIPVVRDRVAQKALLMRIEPILEKEFEACSFAYRKGRSIRQVAERIRALYGQGYRWVADGDIDAFFDLVDHTLMKQKLHRYLPDADVKHLIHKWLAAEIWDGKTLTILERGIPQGSPLSPVLANLFLDELDEAMLAQGFHFIRYADDFIILCKNRRQAFDGLAFSKKVLETLSLELDEEAVTSFDRGFKYLGIFFFNSMVLKPFGRQKQNRKVLYYPPPMDMAAYLLKRKGMNSRGEPLHHGAEQHSPEDR